MRDQTLALAGFMQALTLVRQTALTGRYDLQAMSTSIASIFNRDAATTADVYQGPAALALGLESLLTDMGEPTNQERDPLRIKMGWTMLAIERNLRDADGAWERLGNELDRIQALELATESETIQQLAKVYERAVSVLTPRVMVMGDPEHMNNQRNIAAIRAALLAALRSAVLWRQLGGSMWDLFLQRGSIKKEAHRWQRMF